MAAPVDPLEAVIALLGADAPLAALVDGRIAARHRFALADDGDGARQGWPTPSAALTLAYDGPDGDADTADGDAAMERVKLTARCYGPTPRAASEVWAALMDAVRAATKQAVTLPDGRRALLYWLWPGDGPTAEQDPDVRVDAVRQTVRACVARSPLA